MKKVKVFSLISLMLLLAGCSTWNESYNKMASYEKEKYKCVNGKNIWIMEKGNDEGITLISQIVGECGEDGK